MKKKRRIEVVVDRERICVIRRNFPFAAPGPKDPGVPFKKYTGSKPARKEKV